MADYKRTLEVFGSLLFASSPGSPLLDPTMKKAWGLLLAISKNHMTAHASASESFPEGETEAQRLARIAACRAKILTYATLAVKVRLQSTGSDTNSNWPLKVPVQHSISPSGCGVSARVPMGTTHELDTTNITHGWPAWSTQPYSAGPALQSCSSSVGRELVRTC